ncbi:hypothetical protein Runsl_4593 [Runella slithyformis DSM 19594]|uniref:Uncharacterized protein n=1 Tax=Runella slithyformis (strain ATCC 29530 / DSM 19594 / LMG 11500 / NCIMB 11436 / LSU 4) TaxID=761193 RepID=A0A7U4E7R0_RUNSL|nr:hypothetical protein Runsl_4593 [Runella slithyformis DSM 19594]
MKSSLHKKVVPATLRFLNNMAPLRGLPVEITRLTVKSKELTLFYIMNVYL